MTASSTTSSNGSGDIFLAFSTANPEAFTARGLASLAMVSNEEISPIFDATAWATDEAIINALVAAETMTGANSRRVERLPHDGLRAALKKYNRLAP
jgi:L-aminopeptidase/D-esterase-like protein